MSTPITQPQTTIHGEGPALYVLVLDAQGKPLALAPLERLRNNPFPVERIRLIDGEARLVENGGSAPFEQAVPDITFVRLVESALKRSFDLSFLCEHPLTRTRTVTLRLGASSVPATCLDRARIVRTMLQEAIEQLRPVGPVPAHAVVPRREWHPYLILHDAYIKGDPNYQIMNWLQIGEGTFNRTRRGALETVAKVWLEMEKQVA